MFQMTVDAVHVSDSIVSFSGSCLNKSKMTLLLQDSKGNVIKIGIPLVKKLDHSSLDSWVDLYTYDQVNVDTFIGETLVGVYE